MLYFCTLFDANYAAKGLSLYYSLKEHCPQFHLYIFAFDHTTYRVLNKLYLPNVSIISLAEFEDKHLLAVKQSRSQGEYCWTATPSTILYCLDTFKLEHCTYIDADLYFFSNPEVLFQEMGENDVMITEHRYTPEYDQTATSGKYCVQYLTVKNTHNGLSILKWWRDSCLDWCYATFDNGRFGDQMYLDDWTTRFTAIHELQHLGGGIAPWNIQQYSFLVKNNILTGVEINSVKEFPVIFYHFHAVYAYQKSFMREFFFEGYRLPDNGIRFIYKEYIQQLKKSFRQIYNVDKSFDSLATKCIQYTWFKYAKVIRRRILNKDNKYIYWLNVWQI